MSMSSDTPPRSISVDVVQTVADHTGCDVTTLPSLHNAVNTDALDSLFAPTRQGLERPGEVSFVYAGCRVTVTTSTDQSVDVELTEA